MFIILIFAVIILVFLPSYHQNWTYGQLRTQVFSFLVLGMVFFFLLDIAAEDLCVFKQNHYCISNFNQIFILLNLEQT